jgi:hypothetical protein
MSPTEIRLAMWRNGYAPLPIIGKDPAINGARWQEKRKQTSEAEIRLWGTMWPLVGNTGALTYRTPVLDVDVLDRAACRAVYGGLVERFEDAGIVCCRVGRAPKFAVPFRTNSPLKKIVKKIVSPAGVEMKFEFLGDGGQFVADGVHPDTRQGYQWFPADRNPTTVPRDALPPIDEGAANALVDGLIALLVNDHGFTRPEKPKERAPFVPRSDGASRSPRAVRASVDGLIRCVLGGTPSHDRNNRLFWAACRVHDMAQAGELPDDELQEALECLGEAARRTGLPTSEIDRSIASAMRPRA